LIEPLTSKNDHVGEGYRDEHDADYMCDHDKQVIKEFHGHMGRMHVTGTHADPYPLLYQAVRMEEFALRLRQGYGEWDETGQDCTACDFLKDIEKKFADFFKRTIGRRRGEMSSEAQDVRGCDCGYSQRQRHVSDCDCGYSEAMRLLFYGKLGHTLMYLSRLATHVYGQLGLTPRIDDDSDSE